MRRSMVVIAALGVALGGAACGGKKKSSARAQPPIEGLAAVPASASVVFGADGVKLTQSELVSRAATRMFERDPVVGKRLRSLAKECSFDPAADLKTLVIGMGRGSDEVILIATGTFDESALAQCVNASLSDTGGRLTSKPVDGRTFYRAEGGEHVVWFTVGGNGTIAISSSEAWLREAVSGGAKISDNKGLMQVIGLVDQKSTIWAAGEVPESVGRGMVEVTRGAVKQPMRAWFGELALETGIRVRVGAQMADEEDSKALESRAILELALSALRAQRFGLGPIVSKVKATADGPVVRLDVELTLSELNEVLSKLPQAEKGEVDSGGPHEQDSPGSNPGPTGAQ